MVRWRSVNPAVKGAGKGGGDVTRGTKGVVNRVLQGLHTLHTFFREKGRGAPRDFFFSWNKKKILRPTPGTLPLAEARKPCKVCNPQTHLAPPSHKVPTASPLHARPPPPPHAGPVLGLLGLGLGSEIKLGCASVCRRTLTQNPSRLSWPTAATCRRGVPVRVAAWPSPPARPARRTLPARRGAQRAPGWG